MDTFISANADDLLIAHSVRNKDMIVLSLQPEVCKQVAWSDKARLTLNISKCEIAFFSLDCAEAAWQPNITIDENRCSAIPSRFSLVSDTTGSSPLQSMCVSSANRCPAVSTSSVLWEARPVDGTLRTVVRPTSRLCVECLNMQLQPGHLGCQLPPQQT